MKTKSQVKHVSRNIQVSNSSIPSCVTHAVTQRGITAGLSQQQFDNLDMSMFAGAHQRRGALVVLDVYVGPMSQQGPNHVHPAVTDRQHQSRLTSLQRGRQQAMMS